MNPTIEWNIEKNNILKKTRNISFEDIEFAIANGGLVDVIYHHNQKKYPDQKIFIVRLNSYIYYVPFVENKEKIFLKTIIPSRKYNKKYEK